jgi:hypothetical protein
MSARDIALAKVKEKKDKELEAIRLAEENKVWHEKERKRHLNIVKKVVDQFREDFNIRRIQDDVWKVVTKKGTFYVVLYFNTDMVRYSDDTDPQPVNRWSVDCRIMKIFNVFPNTYYQHGYFDGKLQETVVNDFYCSRLEEEFEKSFGEYMAKWY